MANLSAGEFAELVKAERLAAPGATLAIPLSVRLLSDQLTPVLAYRRLVAADERTAPSFLLESVEGGERQGRHSILGARPVIEVVAHGNSVETTARVRDEDLPTEALFSGVSTSSSGPSENPLMVMREISRDIRLVDLRLRGRGSGLPSCFLGGWVGYAGYDTVRYVEPEKLANAPRDDRGLADLHFGFYDGVVVFDNADKLVYVIGLALLGPSADAAANYSAVMGRIEERARAIQTHSKPLASGLVESTTAMPGQLQSNLTRGEHAGMLAKAMEYIRAGDIFQVVLGQRFERRSKVDPFDVYRALRAVNPSPYMVYLQAQGCILVASSPEILCRVRRHEGTEARRHEGKEHRLEAGATGTGAAGTGAAGTGATYVVTNRPLAGTRKRGATKEEDDRLERELLGDDKERAEHIMLVDLGRNDVGRVAKPGTIKLPAVMEVERYSHVMHISSTVTGELREGLDAWDALAAALPVGTISGAPKVRAMQIIDELEPVRRGPYGGGMGYVGLDGEMDIALALRTMVVPTGGYVPGGEWMYHLQASGGIVADSKAEDEYQETVNKAAALARAIELAERAFG
ncbi:MAG: chorismate-binding protein [Phycisphaerales bacterium]|nr:chorismate-binding protein [Phycisphaerales bacterium]